MGKFDRSIFKFLEECANKEKRKQQKERLEDYLRYWETVLEHRQSFANPDREQIVEAATIVELLRYIVNE